MATKEYHKVSLYRETATLTDESITPGAPSGTLKLGASGNFGVHTLQVELGEGWQGLTVHAIFWLSGEGVLGNSLLSGGEISVPAAVTASPTNVGFVTFSGTSSGVNRLTATLPFIVTDGPPSEGEPSPDPDPSLWQQLFDKMEEVVSTYILPIMSEETLGGGRAIKKTTETVPVAVDPLDGRLYVPEQSGGGGDYKLPQATESTLGGIKAKQRTSETLEVAIDEATGKLYVPQQGGGGGGEPGAAAGFGTPTATASALEPGAQPTVEIQASGPDTAKIFAFTFGIPKGPTGPAGTTDYNALSNKPSIGGVTIEDDKTAEDYGLATKEELPKQATDTEAGIAKFKPIAEQGNNVPASILPDGTVVVPPGGGSTSSWRKIAEIDVTEPVTSIVVSQDGEGKPFSVHDMLVFNTVNLTIDEETNGTISFKLNGGGDISMNITVKQKGGLYFESEWMGYRVFTAGTSGYNAYYNSSGDVARKMVRGTPEKITKFELKNKFGGNFTGGNLIVYGRE